MPHVFWWGAGVPWRIPNSYQRFSTRSPEESHTSLIVEGFPSTTEVTYISEYSPRELSHTPATLHHVQSRLVLPFIHPAHGFLPPEQCLVLPPHKHLASLLFQQLSVLSSNRLCSSCIGNSAGSSITCMEAVFLCVSSYWLLKCTHCLWSCMTSGSNIPSNFLALRYTIPHQGTCRSLTYWDFGGFELQCITDRDLAYSSTEIFGQGHFFCCYTYISLHNWTS